VLVLALFGPRLFHTLQDILAHGLAQASNPSLVAKDGLGAVGKWALLAFLGAMAPIFVVTALAGFLANVAQVKFKVTPKAIHPKFSKINPLPGFKRIFGKHAAVEGVKSCGKLTVVGLAAFFALWPNLHELAGLVGLPPRELAPRLGAIVLSIAWRALLAFGVIAVLDWIWQKRQFENNLKMSKDEVKRESRDADLSPELRGAIRRKQVESHRRRMLAAVPTADVVITNPTHYAVALRYDGKHPAPVVVAKGADLIALKIREIAKEHDVPVLENPPLARALYREVEVDRMIPEEFYAAVAEVLAYVFRTARRRGRKALISAG
jgi:flagellar biosynthetic protein FlhB